MPIRKRGKTYQVDVQVGGIRARRTARSYQAARALESDLKQQLKTQLRGLEGPKTISDALVRWLKEDATGLKSYRKTTSHARNLRPFIEGYALTDAIEAAEEMKRTQRGKISNATINRRLAILRHILNVAYRRWNWLPQPLGLKIELLPEHNTRHIYLTIDEVETLANACQDTRAGDIVRLAAYTGLRRGEIFRLTERNLVDGCIILDGTTKSGRPRVVPLPHGMQVTLPIEINDGLLRRQFDHARKATGMHHIRFHDLRHTYASWLVQSGAPLTAVRDLLGHANLSVTDRYSHLGTEHLRAAVALLSKQNP